MSVQLLYLTLEMSAKMPLPTTRALIVFAVIYTDVALATDFCAYWKRFSRAGIQTTCLSGTDILTTVTIYKTLKFDGEDLNRPRQDVFTRHEANGRESRFYQLIQRRMFKRRILSWFEDIKSSARKGDRIVIILCAHGQSETDVILKGGGGKRGSNASGDIYEARRPNTRREITSSE